MRNHPGQCSFLHIKGMKKHLFKYNWKILFRCKKFVQLHAFDGFVDNQCFCHQAKNRTKSGQNIKDKEREDDDDQITEQKSSGNVHRGVFFDDHGDDVRSAAGSILKKEQGSGDRRKQDRKTEFQ